MIALLQRVSSASVQVQGQLIAEIQQGLLVLVAIEPLDTPAIGQKLLQRILHYRIFADDQARMNRSLRDISGGLLLVPQFTLAADTRSGLRPSFSSAAPPALGQALFTELLRQAQADYPRVQTGQFGADMQVALVNDGPVTILLDSRKLF